MIDVPLQIRRRPTARHPVDAWLIDTDDPHVWLKTVQSWSVDLEAARFIPLRRDADSRECSATLVFGVDVPARAVPNGRPYAQVWPRVFLPVDADLFPPLASSEIHQLLPAHEFHVWRPHVGLVSAEEQQDVLRVVDLIQAPPCSETAWNRAVSGVALPTRLTSLSPRQSLTVDDIFQQGRGDIGRDANSLEDLAKLPPSPKEAKPGLGNTVTRGVAYGVAAGGALFLGALARLGNMRGKQPSGNHGANANTPPWLERLRDSLTGQMVIISDALQARRDREFERLMHMLETNPDQGLRFAIPFGGRTAGRGIARPGGQLTEHGTDFLLPGQGGVGAVDNWDLDDQKQWALLGKYRQLANREMALGRYRRAAYVFSELLGDDAAAASALRIGRHFREAAVLYKEKLRQPLKAAKCLEDGGLWGEAIEQYESLKMFENVGDLYRRLEDENAAVAAYRKEVTAKQNVGDYLKAASLCRTKLEDSDQALTVLADGWPSSKQAEACLREQFVLLNQLGYRDHAHNLMHQLSGQQNHSWSLSTEHRLQATRVLSKLASDSTSTFDRVVVVEATIRIIGQTLPETDVSQSRQLVDAINALHPEDELLRRDGRQFLSRQAEAVKRAQQRRPVVSRRRRRGQTTGLDIERQWHLTAGIHWQSAAVIKNVLFVAGVNEDDEAVASRCSLDGDVDPVRSLKIKRLNATMTPLRVQLRATATGKLCFHAFGSMPCFTQRPWVITDTFPIAPSIVCPGSGDFLGFCVRPGGGVSVVSGLETQGDPQLLHYDAKMSLQGTSVSLEGAFRLSLRSDDVTAPLPMAARGNACFIATGNILTAVGPGERFESLNLDDRIVSLACQTKNIQSPLAVAMRNAIFLVHTMHDESEQLTTTLESPQLTWTPGGFLVAVGTNLSSGQEELQVYQTVDNRAVFYASYELPITTPGWNCVATAHTDQCLCTHTDGMVCLMKIS